MLELLNNRPFDNERNILNADLFVNNLKHTLRGFKFNTKINYEVYRNITIYTITWNDDKTYEDILELKKEIAVSLGINTIDLHIEEITDQQVRIKVLNMKQSTLTLRELLEEAKDNKNIPIGLDDEDNVIYFDIDKDKNILTAGVTGIGKTNLFNDIILNILLKEDNTKIILLDSLGVNYNDYDKLCKVVNDNDSVIKEIHNIRREFEERIKSGNKNDKIVIFIDEIYDIIKQEPSVKDDINYLLELGHTANIHLIISTDSVLDEDINYIFDKDEDVLKLSFYLTSKQEYNKFLDKAVKEKVGRDGIYLSTKDKLVRVSIPLVEDIEIKRVVDALTNKKDK